MAEGSAPLRRGWTHRRLRGGGGESGGEALLFGRRPAVVEIPLPGGLRPSFAVAHEAGGEGFAEAGIVKDAGDDPDVTHGALVIARVERGLRRRRIGLPRRAPASDMSRAPASPSRRASRRSTRRRAA